MTAAEALKAVQDAFYRGRYFLDPHVLRRMAERAVSFHDIKQAVMKAKRAEPFEDANRPSARGVTSWRISGFDLENFKGG